MTCTTARPWRGGIAETVAALVALSGRIVLAPAAREREETFMSPTPFVPAPTVAETPTLTKVLLQNATIAGNGEQRLLPNLDVKKYDRLHIHIGRDAKGVAGLAVKVLFGSPLAGLHCGALLADSTVWFEETVSEREFVWTAPASYSRTGFVVSVPVVAPVLYDVILTNTTPQPLDTVSVTLLAQEI
jgi:hypothetical protein